MNHQIVFVHVK